MKEVNMDKFDGMVNPEYIADYSSKCAVIDEASQTVKNDEQKLFAARDAAIASAEQILANANLACSDKSLEIENKAMSDIAKANAKKENEISSIDARNQISSGEKEAAENSCNEKKALLKAEGEKARQAITAGFESELSNEKSRYATLADERSQTIVAHQKTYGEKLSALISLHENNVKQIEEKISALHLQHKQNDAVNFAAYNKIKIDRDEKIKIKKAEFEKREQSLNNQLKNCNDKQKAKTIKNEITLNKSSFSATERVMQGDINAAKKIYDDLTCAAYAKICNETTEQQRQLRVENINFEFDKARLCEDKKIIDVKLVNEKFKEERQNIENVLEIGLRNQDNNGIQKANELCCDLDIDCALQQIQCAFDTAIAVEEKNLAISELCNQESLNTIECNKKINLAEQKQKAAEALSKKIKIEKVELTECHHKIQVEKIDLFSLCLKTANKNEKLLNSFKSKNIGEKIQNQIAVAKQRLAEDLATINSMKETQVAENLKLISTTEELFTKQLGCLENILKDGIAKDDATEIEIVNKNIESLKVGFETTVKDNAAQHEAIIKMFDDAQCVVQRKSDEEVAGLTAFVSAMDVNLDKNNNRSDERMSLSDDCKKDMVVNLLGNYEKELKYIEEECVSTIDREKNVLRDVTAAATVEKENFIQKVADQKAKEEASNSQKASGIESKKQQFANEIEKNKKAANGLKDEKIANNGKALKAAKDETVQFVNAKLADLKQLESVIAKTVADEKRVKERNIAEVAKLKEKECKWLLKSGKVEYNKSWWIVDFSK